MSNPNLSYAGDVLSLRTRILRAGGWIFGGHVSAQTLRLLSNLVMSRLLLPQMFGVMALANVLLMGLQLFSDLGLGQAIIQSKRGSDLSYLNTVWTAQILRGALICLIALLISVGLLLATSFHLIQPETAYAEPHLPALIAVLSLNGLLGGFVSTRVTTASRNLALGRVTIMELYCQTSAIAVMVSWALFDKSVWALVVGSLVSTIARILLSHTFLPGECNRLHWDRDAFREIFAFGKWVFVTSTLGFLDLNGDRLLLGALVDAKTLGIYVTAAYMVSALQDIFSKISNGVAYPALSEVLRERPHDLLKTFYKFRAPVDAVSLIGTGLVFSAGHLIIRALYSNRYQAAGHMLEILSISLFEVRYGLVRSCFMAMGKPKLLVPVIFLQVAVMFGFTPIAFRMFGLNAALWVIGGSMLVALPLTFRYQMRYGLFSLRNELIVLPWLALGYLFGLLVDKVAALV